MIHVSPPPIPVLNNIVKVVFSQEQVIAILKDHFKEMLGNDRFLDSRISSSVSIIAGDVGIKDPLYYPDHSPASIQNITLTLT